MRTHQMIDERSLEYHKLAVDKIDNDSSLLLKAKNLLKSWDSTAPHPSRGEWRDILSLPWSEAKKIILENTDNGRRIRQTSPLSCLLSQDERGRIAKRYLTDDESVRYDEAVKRRL